MRLAVIVTNHIIGFWQEVDDKYVSLGQNMYPKLVYEKVMFSNKS